MAIFALTKVANAAITVTPTIFAAEEILPILSLKVSITLVPSLNPKYPINNLMTSIEINIDNQNPSEQIPDRPSLILQILLKIRGNPKLSNQSPIPDRGPISAILMLRVSETL